MTTDSTSPQSKTCWRFFRAGGFDQVRLDQGSDLRCLDQLDQKLWVALACPVKGLTLDEKTLTLIDTDQDGRIRVPEIRAAVRWALGLLRDPQELVRGGAALPLAAINDQTEEGRLILSSAQEILRDLGRPDATTISVDDTADTTRIFAQTRFNGDGILPADAADEGPLRQALTEILGCCGSLTDRSGKPGLNQAKLDQFFQEAQAFSDWWQPAETEPDKIRPLGEASGAAVAALDAVRAKVEDYFTRCRLAAFDPRVQGLLNRKEEEYASLATRELTATAQEVAAFPLAHVASGRDLPLQEGLNPAWSGAIQTFVTQVVRPLLGEQRSLSPEQWATLCSRLEPCKSWQAAKPTTTVEPLGLPRLRELLSGDFKSKIEELLAREQEHEPQANAIASVDRLVRYHRDLHRLLRNFVSFRDFYEPQEWAIFQAGTLYLDGRACMLCLRVSDAGKHAALAGHSKSHLVYCDCTRKGSAEKMTIVAAMTDGDADFLLVGRNGVFYDREGQDWDATITKIVDNPISVRQAFWTPYKKVARLIGDQIEKFAASRDKDVQDKASAGVLATGDKATAAAAADPTKPPPAAAPAAFDIAKFAGIFAAIGLALGAIATAIAAVVSGFLTLTWWQMPLALLGVLLLISGPSMLLAWLKLRQRNLGPLLDAEGWAVNTRARINIPFGKALTELAKLPPGAQRSLQDPFADKRNPWIKWVVLLALLAAALFFLNQRGMLHDWSGGRFGSPPPVVVPNPATGAPGTATPGTAAK